MRQTGRRSTTYCPAPPYEPEPAGFDDGATAYLNVEEVAKNVVTDRRAGERKGTNADLKTRMENLFYGMHDIGASDLHLSTEMPPMVRKDGKIQKLECDETTLSPDLMKELLMTIMPERNREEFTGRHDTDFAYEITGLARFRCNIFNDRKGMGGVFRIIPANDDGRTTRSVAGYPQPMELKKGLWS